MLLTERTIEEEAEKLCDQRGVRPDGLVDCRRISSPTWRQHYIDLIAQFCRVTEAIEGGK